MTKKNYLETFEKCPGSLYFPLLMSGSKKVGLAPKILDI